MHESAPPGGDPDHRTGRLRRALARVLVRGADAATRWVTHLLGESATAGRERISQAELRDLVAANTSIDPEGRRLIDEVLAVGARHVRELMVPRTEVVFLDRGMTIADAVRVVRDASHSRFPVVDGSRDDVIGFVHLRDLLIRPEEEWAVTVGALAREVKRLPAAMRVLTALSQMRREGSHLAVVVDEYGGTAGVVTLEDLLEEFVGEIHDEYDEVPLPAAGPGEIDARLNLSDFAESAGLTLPPGPYETVGGFIMAALGRLPEAGDVVDVPAGRLVVTAMEGRRVARVSIAARPAEQAPVETAPAASVPVARVGTATQPADELIPAVSGS
ncbi:hemolysin family protein [Luedemannella helvata]|uniref:CBS domain-containing protein n=1 Tax=Luedemannella helvata TaxID=349315 RepID=A0ABP4VTF6_9ACTN